MITVLTKTDNYIKPTRRPSIDDHPQILILIYHNMRIELTIRGEMLYRMF